MTKRAECPACRATFPLRDPVTFEVRGFVFGEDTYCTERCAATWSLAEVQRLRGWLRRIFTRCGGIAGRLARKALHTNHQITDDV